MSAEKVSVPEGRVRALRLVPGSELEKRETTRAMVELAREAHRLELRMGTAEQPSASDIQ